jgi:hypothetical protein
MKVLGVDPGVTGGWAVLRLEVGSGEVARVTHAGDVPVRRIGKTLTLVDTLAWRALLDAERPDVVVVERVHSSPRMGAKAAFTFGGIQAGLLGVLELEGYAFGTPRLVRPVSSVWKGAMRVPPEKEQARALATRLLGGSGLWPLKKHHNRAEAALLAVYGLAVSLGQDLGPSTDFGT